MRVKRVRLDSETRKEQVLDATLQIIAESGVQGLNISEIARRVGIVPSALYRHFRDKEALIDSLLARTHRQLAENVNRASGGEIGALRRLKQLFRLHVELLRRNPGIPKLVFSYEVGFSSQKRREDLRSIVGAYAKRIEAIVQMGQDEGKILGDVDSSVIAFAFVSLVQNVGITLSLTAGKIDRGLMACAAWEIFERGLRTSG
jgi:AcrR family transcriptional regulator